jgi:type IV secretion system protein VirB9
MRFAPRLAARAFAALSAATLTVMYSAALAQPTRAADPRLLTVVFAPDRVLDVPVRRGQVTQIVLADDEQIIGVPLTGKGANCADDSHTWCVARAGRDLFIKPKTGATSTNLFVVTDRRRHVFVLHPVEAGQPSLMRLTVVAPAVPQLAVADKQELVATVAPAIPQARTEIAPALTAQQLIDTRWQAKPLLRNTAYSVATGKDSDDIVPVMVFDDGTHTYLSFPNNRPLPAVFEVTADGSEEMVNTRMDADDLLVADRVGRRFVLRLGQSVAAIINDAYDADGVPPKDGTTVPGVARVIKKATVAAVAAVRPNAP